MSLISGMGNSSERPPHHRHVSGHLWFARALIGAAFTLCVTAISAPLVKQSDWTLPIQTNQVYPFQVGKAPDLWSVYVDGAIIAVFVAAIASGAVAVDDDTISGFGEACTWIAGGVCVLFG